MNSTLVAMLAAIVAAQARIEGMRAANAPWIARGESPVYGEQAFFIEANLLDQLSIEARNAS